VRQSLFTFQKNFIRSFGVVCSLRALLLTWKTCKWTVQNNDHNLFTESLHFEIQNRFFMGRGTAPSPDSSPSPIPFGASIVVASIFFLLF